MTAEEDRPGLDAAVEIPEDVHFRDLDGEAILLNATSGRYYGLDEVGTRIWLLLAEHGRLQTVLDALLARYDVAAADLERDLLELVRELAGERLLEIRRP
ncbi:MAG: PqqD family peptide modification chaperone [Thermoanaerobaculia bacterium]|nr:PqqD family peptide modification chaperone [Thermoanaerobaculia bacterium]